MLQLSPEDTKSEYLCIVHGTCPTETIIHLSFLPVSYQVSGITRGLQNDGCVRLAIVVCLKRSSLVQDIMLTQH